MQVISSGPGSASGLSAGGSNGEAPAVLADAGLHGGGTFSGTAPAGVGVHYSPTLGRFFWTFPDGTPRWASNEHSPNSQERTVGLTGVVAQLSLIHI